jgi:hypothetical protein
MIIYKVCRKFESDYETDIKFFKSTRTATQYFNNLIRQYIKESEIVNEDYFEEEITNLRKDIKEFYSHRKIVCRKYPVLIYEDVGTLVCKISYLYPISSTGMDWDIGNYYIVIEEIELLD